MRLQITDPSVRTSQFYREDLMADHYDPPGINVHEAEDGTRHFRCVAAVGEALLEEQPDLYAEYDPDPDSNDEDTSS